MRGVTGGAVGASPAGVPAGAFVSRRCSPPTLPPPGRSPGPSSRSHALAPTQIMTIGGSWRPGAGGRETKEMMKDTRDIKRKVR